MTTPTPTPPEQPDKTILTDLNGGGMQPPDQTLATRAPSLAASGAIHDVGGHVGEAWGDFVLGELLGKGGMGAVYKGRQASLDRAVAVKVLPDHLSQDEGFRTRFALEAKAVAQISSPHVIQVYAAGQHQGHHYFAMEFVEGQDLGQRLRAGYRPTYAQSLDHVLQAARGLAAAGELGIIHRDIKPANMLVTPKGLLKLMDFGLVKLASSKEATGLTRVGTIMGTVNYLSPEQGRGEECDQRTDIYALGVVFYELLTGKLPFSGADATSVIYQHVHQLPRKPKEIDPQIPEDYQAVVLKCMQKRPEDRYRTAGELVEDLVCLQEGRAPATAFVDPSSLRHGATIIKPGSFRRERPAYVRLTLALLVAIGLGAGGVEWFRRQQSGAVAPLAAPVPADAGGGAAALPRPDPARADEPAEAALARVRGLVAAHGFAEARALQAARASAAPGEAAWKELGLEIDRAEGEASLAAAEARLAAGDPVSAGEPLARARRLLGEGDAGVVRVASAVTASQSARRERDRALAEAVNTMALGEAAKAVELLEALARANPGDAEIAAALQRANKQRGDAEALRKAVADQIAKAQQALERKDFDNALLAFTAARQLDPQNAAAAQGLERIDRVKDTIAEARGRFTAALAKREVAAAEAALGELRAIAPGSSVVILAEAELGNSRLAEDERRRLRDQAEAGHVAHAKRVQALIDDPRQDIPTLEEALAAFVAASGLERPERPLLERGIEDRRQRLAVERLLAGLDAAVLGGDAAAVRAAVADQAHATALCALSGRPGLVFAGRISAFSRQGEQATATVDLRHALAVFPERILVYRYDLRRDGAGWVISNAVLQR